MLTTKLNKLRMIGALAVALGLSSAAVRAVVVQTTPCPANANATGSSVGIAFIHHASGLPVFPQEVLSPCEQIDVIVNVGYKAPSCIPSPLTTFIYESFQGGQVTLTRTVNGGGLAAVGSPQSLPSGVIIGPATGNSYQLNCTSPATVLNLATCSTPAQDSVSLTFTYTVAPGEAGTTLNFLASYGGGIASTGGAVTGGSTQDQPVGTAVSIATIPNVTACLNAQMSPIVPTVTGGNTPYTYAWRVVGNSTPVSTASSFTPSSATVGTTAYQLTVTDKNGCSGQTTFIVVINPNPIVTVNNPSTCAGTPTAIVATVTGSTVGGNHYVWSGPAGTGPFADQASIVVTVAGSYSVIVTDANGCSGSGSGVLTVTPKPVVTVNNAAVCSGSPATLTASLQGSVPTPITYGWSGPVGTGPFPNQASITVTVAGTYTVTVTDGNNCVGTAQGVVTVNAKPVVNVNSAVICAGATATLTATATGAAGVTFPTYAWSGPVGTGPFPNSATITTGVAGTYTVTVTDSNGCTQTAQGIVVVNPNPIVTVNSDSICAGGRSTLTATVTGSVVGGNHYVWTGPNGTGPFADSAAIVVTVAGNYCVTVTDGNGCTGNGCGTLTVNPVPVVTVSSPSVCQGGTATVTATVTGSTSTPFSYAWSGPVGTGPFNNAASITTTVGGTYTVVVTDHNGCVGSGVGTVTVNPRPFVALQPITVCSGTPASLRASADACGPMTFSWTGPNGFTATGNPISVTAGGTYTVTITDCHNCQNSASTTVSIDTVRCAVSPQFCIICDGSFKTLTANPVGGVGPYTYVWSDGSTASTLRTNKAGFYTVTVTDSKGCSSSCTGEVTIDTLSCGITPSCVSCQTLAVCNGSTITLSGASIGGLAPFQYVWSTGETTQSITVSQAGVYTLYVSDANGCTATFSATVTSCDQCVTRDSSFWFTHVVSPPGLPQGTTCATLQSVFNLMPNSMMNLGYLQVTLNQALGIFWGNQSGPASPSGIQSAICNARKTLAIELMTAIANTTLLNADSSGCGVIDPNTGGFILIGTLIAEAQAATQQQPSIFDCNTQVAWVNEMAGLQNLLHLYNAGGTSQALPAPLSNCGVGFANANYVHANMTDPTTLANCGCPSDAIQ